MMRPKVVLVVGFGNLGAKLLSLRWAFPFLRFAFIERSGEYFWNMRQKFQQIGTLGDLMDAREKDLNSNLYAFRDALDQPANNSSQLPENLALKMGKLFDDHVYYGGDYKGPSARAFEDARARYQTLIRGLIEYDRSEVLLYLATHPEQYLDSLKQYSFFANCVAVDKPLAKDDQSLAAMKRFAEANPHLTILPIDHYLFKLDFTEFMTELERRGGLNPREVQRLDVTICEKELDESRQYFLNTGIISDMMPHVSAMVSLLFRNYRVTRAAVGNVTPFVRFYSLKERARSGFGRPRSNESEAVIVKARIELNYWTGEGYLPVSVYIAKGEKRVRKEIVITWHTGEHTTIKLARSPKAGQYADWAGALKYLINDWSLLEPMRSHFTFDRACEITADVLACQKQAELKIPPRRDGPARAPLQPVAEKQAGTKIPRCDKVQERATFLRYPATAPPPREVFILNFDGVVINTEAAHIQAWRTWYEIIGHVAPDLEDEEWYEPGKPNRDMVSSALARLYVDDEAAASFAIQYGEKYYGLFHHILRGEKLQKLEESLPGKGGVESEYHEKVRYFLQMLRQFNQHIVLVTTNHPLLVQQTLNQLLCAGDGGAAVGFDRYYVGERKGPDAYGEIIKDCRKKWGKRVKFIILDDYLNALEYLQARFAGERDGAIRLIHMDTMKNVGRRKTKKKRSEGIECYKDFQKLIDEFYKKLCKDK